MAKYRRAKREDYLEPQRKMLSIYLGSEEDSFESLKIMCNDKCIDLLKTVELEKGEEMDVAFWTEDFPELIGTATIFRNENGLLEFKLDYSQSTL